VLPKGYFAAAEQVVVPFEADVLALEVPVPKNRTGRTRSLENEPPNGGGTLTLAASPPRVRIVEAQPKAPRIPRKDRRIAIRHSSKNRLVAVIEIVSPGNKANKREFQSFVDKSIVVLEQGIHLLVIDPFPPTPRDPSGIHAAIWRGLVRK